MLHTRSVKGKDRGQKELTAEFMFSSLPFSLSLLARSDTVIEKISGVSLNPKEKVRR